MRNIATIALASTLVLAGLMGCTSTVSDSAAPQSHAEAGVEDTAPAEDESAGGASEAPGAGVEPPAPSPGAAEGWMEPALQFWLEHR